MSFLAMKAFVEGYEKGQENGGKSTKNSKPQKFMNALLVASSLAVIYVVGKNLFPGLKGFGGMLSEVAPEDIEVVFDDVKGCDEAKKELQEIVEFLMNPEKFSKLGGKLPKGVLLSGKYTLLACRGIESFLESPFHILEEILRLFFFTFYF